MKRIKLVGLTVFAILALSALGTASAIAEPGFLPKQASANVLGGKYTIATVGGGLSLACAKLDASTITMTTDEHGSGTLSLLECKAAGLFTLNSLGDKAGVVLEPVLFLVCLDPKNAEGKLLGEFGFYIELDKPLHLEIPALGSLFTISGRIIGVILSKGKTKLFVVDLAEKPGTPFATSCKQGGETKGAELAVEENEAKKTEPASEDAEGLLIQFPNEVELMDS
ncbi:MAG TPA: hypothetical protein VK774_08675 [Solirubrobacteraceae bacterium]|jgi:hypothetical protein|nr:hypothetical protein [Solirubrobacteraceae bacterium]